MLLAALAVFDAGLFSAQVANQSAVLGIDPARPALDHRERSGRLTCWLISRASRLRTGARALDHLPGRRVLGWCGPEMAESDAGAALALVAQ